MAYGGQRQQMRNSIGTGTLRASTSSPGRPADADSSAGFVDTGHYVKGTSRSSKGSYSARTPRRSNPSGASSPGSTQRETPSRLMSSVSSMSVGSSKVQRCASSSSAGRDLWYTGDPAQMGTLGNMKESLKSDALLKLEANREAKRHNDELRKRNQEVKYQRRIESQESWQDKLKRLRAEAHEVYQVQSSYRQQEKQHSKDSARRGASLNVNIRRRQQNEAVIPGIRLERDKRVDEIDHKISQQMRVQAEREKLLYSARAKWVQDQEAWQREAASSEAEALTRYAVKQKKQARLSQAPRSGSARQARQEEQGAKQQELPVNRRPRGRSEMNMVFEKARSEQDLLRNNVRLVADKERCAADQRRARSLELLERRKELQKIREKQAVEQRQSRSSSIKGERWEQARDDRWGLRDLSLNESDGDIPMKTLAFMLPRRAARQDK